MKRNFNISITIATIAAVLTTVNAFAAGDATGNWEGKIFFGPSTTAGVQMNLARGDEAGLSGTLSTTGQNNQSFELRNVRQNGSAISFDLNDGRTVVTFDGLLASGGVSIKGEFTQAGQKFPFEFSRQESDLTTKPQVKAASH